MTAVQLLSVVNEILHWYPRATIDVGDKGKFAVNDRGNFRGEIDVESGEFVHASEICP